MIIDKNYFEVFGLPEQYSIDLSRLKVCYRELQKEFHPDRYASGSKSEIRLALQYSTYINEAYERLISPLKRAEYLLFRKGVEQDQAKTMSSDAGFLMQQIAWRESLGDVRQASDPDAALETLSDQISHEQLQMQQAFEKSYLQLDMETALAALDKMRFVEKLQQEITLLEEELIDY